MSSDAWKKEHTVTFSIRLTKNVDQDLIDWLATKDSRNGYIRDLIRDDLKKQNRKAKKAE